MALALTAVALFVSAPAWAGPVNEAYATVKVTGGLIEGRGAVAWSPSGIILAAVTDRGSRLVLLNTVTSQRVEVTLPGAREALWISDMELAALCVEGGQPVLIRMNDPGQVTGRTALPAGTVAVHPHPQKQGRLVALTEQYETISIGTRHTYTLNTIDREGKAARVYSTGRIAPRFAERLISPSGWFTSGLNPFSATAAVLEHIVPPAAEAYLKAGVVDADTGAREELFRIPVGALAEIHASWSPRGRSLALVEERGLLRVLGMNGAISTVNDAIAGAAPAWHPADGGIFFGGVVMALDGTILHELIANREAGARAMGWWRPDGQALALASEGGLWIVTGMDIQPGAERAPSHDEIERAGVLKGLLTDGLIDARTYKMRMRRLGGEADAPEMGSE
jgi:hypothetical protein